jgi:hypothetical protein
MADNIPDITSVINNDFMASVSFIICHYLISKYCIMLSIRASTRCNISSDSSSAGRNMTRGTQHDVRLKNINATTILILAPRIFRP